MQNHPTANSSPKQATDKIEFGEIKVHFATYCVILGNPNSLSNTRERTYGAFAIYSLLLYRAIGLQLINLSLHSYMLCHKMGITGSYL